MKNGTHNKQDLPENLPTHVAIIPDGNRRWARDRKLPTLEGHRRGLKTVVELGREVRKAGIPYFTLWFFSTENWTRSKIEVAYLMKLAEDKMSEMHNELVRDKVRFRHFGRKDRIPATLAKKFAKLEAETREFTENNLSLAFDYGGRDEIITVMKKIAKEGLKPEEITPEVINERLFTVGVPDPDLIIRTSGEQRLSGYFPWQGVYAELYFATVHCPDFDFKEFKKALWEYSERDRRKGGDSKKKG